MKLECSAGHQWDGAKAYDRWWKGDKKPGDRCGEELHYDRVGGLRRCRRVLRKVSSPNATVEARREVSPNPSDG